MKITIEVPDEHGAQLEKWLAAIKKPKREASQEISLVISTKTSRASWLDTNALRVPLHAITHDYVREFKVGDVVQSTLSPKWGVVIAVEGGKLIIRPSKETLADTGLSELMFDVDDAIHLV